MSSGLKVVDEARVQREAAAAAAGRYVVTERLVRDRATGNLVPEDTAARGNLVYIPGQEIPLAEARLAGLVRETPAAAPVTEAPEVASEPATPEAAPRPTARRKGK